MEKIKNGVVFSNDINLIINGKNALNYIYTNNGILVPNNNFIESLRNDFRKDTEKYYGVPVSIINEEEMTYYMNKYIEELKGEYPIVSMDEIYVECDNKNVFALDCTRFQNIMVTRKNPKDLDGVRKEVERIAKIIKSNGKKRSSFIR